jgi:hypothetical protein
MTHPSDNDRDEREEARELFGNLRAALPQLEKLFERVSGEWGYEDLRCVRAIFSADR